MTGGLVQFERPMAALTLAEVVLNTASGPVKALVEFLKPQGQENSQSRAFRFVALDDPDFQRLAATIKLMSSKDQAEDRQGNRQAEG